MKKMRVFIWTLITFFLLSCSNKKIEKINKEEYFDRLKAVEEYYQFLCISKEDTIPVDEVWFQKMEVFYDDVSYFEKITNCKFHFVALESLPVYNYDCCFYKDYTYLVLWYYENINMFY